MTGTMRVPRSRGAFSGVLLLLLGLWGGLLPFVGPYADFGFSPDDPWVYDTDRLQLSIAPAIAVGLGGLIVLSSANRAFAMFGAWLAIAGGAWFAVGTQVATLWDVNGIGEPLGTGEGQRLAEQLSAFTGLGVAAVFFAALALGRFAVVGVKEAELSEGTAYGSTEGNTNTTQPLAPTYGRYGRHSADHPPQGPPPQADQRVAGERDDQPSPWRPAADRGQQPNR